MNATIGTLKLVVAALLLMRQVQADPICKILKENGKVCNRDYDKSNADKSKNVYENGWGSFIDTTNGEFLWYCVDCERKGRLTKYSISDREGYYHSTEKKGLTGLSPTHDFQATKKIAKKSEKEEAAERKKHEKKEAAERKKREKAQKLYIKKIKAEREKRLAAARIAKIAAEAIAKRKAQIAAEEEEEQKRIQKIKDDPVYQEKRRKRIAARKRKREERKKAKAGGVNVASITRRRLLRARFQDSRARRLRLLERLQGF